MHALTIHVRKSAGGQPVVVRRSDWTPAEQNVLRSIARLAYLLVLAGTLALVGTLLVSGLLQALGGGWLAASANFAGCAAALALGGWLCRKLVWTNRARPAGQGSRRPVVLGKG